MTAYPNTAKGIPFVDVDSVYKIGATQTKFTGKLRWYGGILQQEVESTTWVDGYWQDHKLEWIDVPQVPVDNTGANWLYPEPEPGEHAEVLAALDEHNSGEEE